MHGRLVRTKLMLPSTTIAQDIVFFYTTLIDAMQYVHYKSHLSHAKGQTF